MGGISVWQIAIVIIIIAVLFGGRRLRNLGGDLGASLKGFKKAMQDEDQQASNIEHKASDIKSTSTVIDKEKTK